MFTLLILALSPIGIAATQVKVTAATPASTYQGTVSLDVVVNGSGFDNTAKVQFLVSGTTNPGGVTVKKVVFRNSGEVVATIDVADTANIANFDIVVMLSDGRKGKGTTLFAVQPKTADPCNVSGIDFPAFTYWLPTATKGQQIYIADAAGKCSRPVYQIPGSIAGASAGAGAFSYPVLGTTDVGRVIWREGDGGIYGLTFKATGSSIAVSARQLIVDTLPYGVIDMDLSKDGTTVYAVVARTDGVGPNKVIAINVAGGPPTDAFVGPPDGTGLGYIAVNEDGVLFFPLSAPVADPGTTNPLLRVAPPCADTSCSTVLASSPSGTHGNNFPAPNLVDSRLVYSYDLPGYVGCWLLQIIPDTGGSIVNSGQPRYGTRSTWYRDKILTNGIKPPSGSGRCDSTGMITQIDPATSAETPLVKGYDPDGR